MTKICGFLMVFLLCSVATAVGAEDARTGTISGKMKIKNGGPLANGVVFFFNEASGPPPSPEKYWRVPDEIVGTDGEGNFKAVLLEGKYYLGASKRKSGQEVGPPQEGDYFLPAMEEKGVSKTFHVEKGKTADIGTIAEAIPFSRATVKTGSGITAIEGSITDAEGKPLERAMVFAFLTPAMVGKPLFVSERTGKDGKYLLRVNQGGDYYLKIRDVYGGGAPKVGEIMGGYGQDKPMPVTVKTGTTVKGIDIKGVRFLGRGPNQ
ncbi:carboxypeptidase-like regulatory domain-containing protein [Geomobilimonas luticola]|uniref:Carboxypeptidase regulatory-like domain-containing protein n=1 Tax=Geomobilimonas luticola TaxID=1114878 RepID=A0ABS5SAB2_9BACT|nr:carboxypeptidase-like regulatory domain-containing protein [Geomobilimonas luticola]MBT0652309.1 carboxypeptidase regulatory-like domain-containing protein [Geomobilimonas luticola]